MPSKVSKCKQATMKSRVPGDVTPSTLTSTASTASRSSIFSSQPPRDGLVGEIVEGCLNDEPSAPRRPAAISYECSHLTYFAALLEDTRMNGDGGGDDDDSINIFQRVQDQLLAKHLRNGTLKLTGSNTIRSAGASETSSSRPSPSSSSTTKVRRLSFGQKEKDNI